MRSEDFKRTVLLNNLKLVSPVFNRYFHLPNKRILHIDPLKVQESLNPYSYINSVVAPIRFETSFYQYTENNPLNFVDPYGLSTIDILRYGPGAAIMAYYYLEMKRMDWKGSDAYYHCLASCKVARIIAPDVNYDLGILWEFLQWKFGMGWDVRDITSNIYGMTCPLKESCEEHCRALAPPGMPIR